MLDRDLADLYESETKALNLAVKRNIKRIFTMLWKTCWTKRQLKGNGTTAKE